MKMQMLRLLVIVAVTPGALALVSKTNPVQSVAQDDSQEDVVRVAEPDVVADDSEYKATPSKALTQTAAKIVDNGAKDVSEFTEAKVASGAGLASDAGEDEEVVKVATPDVVQDPAANAKVNTGTGDKMDAKITFEDDEDVVKTVTADVVVKKEEGQKTQPNKVQSHAIETKTKPSTNQMVGSKQKVNTGTVDKMDAKIEFKDNGVVKTVDADVVVKKEAGQKTQPNKVQIHAVETKTKPSKDQMVAPEIEAEAPKVEAQVVQKDPVLDDDDDAIAAPLQKDDVPKVEDEAPERVEAQVVQTDPVLEDDAVVDELSSVKADLPKQASAMQVAAPKVKVAAVKVAAAAPKQLKALAIKKNLRGPDIDENGEEYVAPSEVKYSGEEFVTVVPYPASEVTEAPSRPKVVEAQSVRGYTNGQVVEADVVKVASAPQRQDFSQDIAPVPQEDIASVPQASADTGDETSSTETDSVPEDSSDIEDRAQPVDMMAEPEAKKQHECDGGSEFNNNGC